MGAVAQRAQAGEMVGMKMRIDRLDQLEVEFADKLDVTVDLLQYRIDNERLAPTPAGEKVGVSAGHAVEELAKNHPGDSPIQGLRIPSGPARNSINLPCRSQKGGDGSIPWRTLVRDHLPHRRAERGCGTRPEPWSAPWFKLSVRSGDRRAIPIPTMNRRKAPWADCRARRARTKGLRPSAPSRKW